MPDDLGITLDHLDEPADADLRVIRGTVARLFHSSPTFCAGRLQPARGEVATRGEINFAGKVFVRQGESVALQGRWVDDDKYGRQFSVISRIHEDTITPDGLAAWLTVHGEAHRIGPVKARKIAKEFGENFAGWLRDNPEQVAITAGVPLATVKALAASWEDAEQFNAVGMKLAIWELTGNQIKTLYDKFRGSIVALLEENPYLLIGEVPGLGFKRIDAIARKVGVPPTHPGRIDAAITFSLTEEEDEGSTCMERASLVDATAEALGDGEPETLDLIAVRLAALQESEKVRVVRQGGREFLALPRNWRYEQAISEFLKTADQSNPCFPDGTDHEALAATCEKLDESQQRAVTMALRKRACLISGGAGSGKSTMIAALAKLYREAGQRAVVIRQEERYDEDGWEIDDFSLPDDQPGCRVALAAPTGKAARRLEEVASGFTASTIHRLLGYGPVDGFAFRQGSPLPVDVVILDESSMLCSQLAYHTVAAIGPQTALVLVGDHHQLPPVGAGALLRDAIQHELLPMTILNQCHRHAGPLKENCQAILRGEVPPTVDWPVSGAGPGPWYVCKTLHTPDAVLAYAARLFTDVLTKRLGFDAVKDVQFLTPIHAGAIGTRALNIMLQRLHQKTLGVEVEPVTGDKRPKLYVGDKVIQTKNNYALDVMNGHQGVVLVPGREMVVDFGGKIVEIPKDCAVDIELAYCLTPHKVQGSEMSCVVVICHKTHRFMLHRNWLYTAATRSQKTCVILGDPEGIEHAAKRIVNNQRRTLLPIFAGEREPSGKE